MNFLAGLFTILLSFQAGYIPDGNNVNYGISENEYEVKNLDNAFSAEFHVILLFKEIFFFEGVYNSIFYAMNPEYDFGFSPDHDTYTIKSGIRYAGFEIGYSHKCFHPIFPYQFVETSNSSTNPIALMEGAITEYYIKFDAKLGL